WNTEEELPQQEGTKRAEQKRNDESLVGIQPTELAHEDVPRHDQHLIRHHQAGQQDEEDNLPPLESKLRKSEASQGGNEHTSDGTGYGHNNRVEVQPFERDCIKYLLVVCPTPKLRNHVLDHLLDTSRRHGLEQFRHGFQGCQ